MRKLPSPVRLPAQADAKPALAAIAAGLALGVIAVLAGVLPWSGATGWLP
jgi:hypothetical protein